MTEFFNYDELTWPEVAELPRDVPLILPLGRGYDFRRSWPLSSPIHHGLDCCRPSHSAGTAAGWNCRRSSWADTLAT